MSKNVRAEHKAKLCLSPLETHESCHDQLSTANITHLNPKVKRKSKKKLLSSYTFGYQQHILKNRF